MFPFESVTTGHKSRSGFEIFSSINISFTFFEPFSPFASILSPGFLVRTIRGEKCRLCVIIAYSLAGMNMKFCFLQALSYTRSADQSSSLHPRHIDMQNGRGGAQKKRPCARSPLQPLSRRGDRRSRTDWSLKPVLKRHLYVSL